MADRPRAEAGASRGWLLIGAAPLWFLGGHFFHGYAAGAGRNMVPDPLLKLLTPRGDAVMDVDARFRYPMRTHGSRVVMISTPMPEEWVRARVAAMDRQIRMLEGRLGRTIGWTVHWLRGPILGNQGRTHGGMSLGSLPGEGGPDVEPGPTS
ncbi:MAG: hypothetical protein ACYC61_19305 [Isosphaeraceae bacterium]